MAPVITKPLETSTEAEEKKPIILEILSTGIPTPSITWYICILFNEIYILKIVILKFYSLFLQVER